MYTMSKNVMIDWLNDTKPIYTLYAFILFDYKFHFPIEFDLHSSLKLRKLNLFLFGIIVNKLSNLILHSYNRLGKFLFFYEKSKLLKVNNYSNEIFSFYIVEHFFSLEKSAAYNIDLNLRNCRHRWYVLMYILIMIECISMLNSWTQFTYMLYL